MKTKSSKKTVLRKWQKQAISVAATAIILMGVFFLTNNNPFVTTARAAENILLKSITAMESLKSMFISMDVRSLESQPFDLIGEDYDYIEYQLWKQFSGMEPWRIEKPGRIVTYNGKNQYLYLPKSSYAKVAEKDANLVEWISIFFNPKKILENEIAFSELHNAKYKIDKTPETITLTVNSDALGDFNNNYLKNKSILESDNKRVYVFDRTTKFLKSFELFINSEGHSIRIIKINNIAYNIPIQSSTFSINLPTGVNWIPLEESGYVKEYTNISSKKAAKRFFSALHNEDFDSLTNIWSTLNITDLDMLEEIKETYGGIEIIEIGNPFKSGMYPGEYIPYKIKSKSGEIATGNLAIRNDNPHGTWIVDGGI